MIIDNFAGSINENRVQKSAAGLSKGNEFEVSDGGVESVFEVSTLIGGYLSDADAPAADWLAI